MIDSLLLSLAECWQRRIEAEKRAQELQEELNKVRDDERKQSTSRS